MTHLERKILDAIAVDDLLADLSALIPLRSLGGSEGAAQTWVASRLAALGMETDVWDIDFDELRGHPAYTAEIEREKGIGVAGSTGRGEGRTLIMNGHVDVVPEGDASGWSVPPWQATIRDGRVYGRGSADMKGGLCCALAAARALTAAGVELAGRLVIESVIGEEDGGCGTLAAIERGYRGDGAIVMEPTGLDVAPAHAGALGFRLEVRGRAAHGSLRDEGVSPIEKFFPIYDALIALERERNASVTHPLFSSYRLPVALSVGVLHSGKWPSTVAETLTCEGRFGVPPGEDLDAARDVFERAVSEASQADPWLREHPPVVTWSGAQFEPAETPADSPVVGTLAAALRAAASRVPVIRGVPYGADMRLLVRQGRTPTVIFGPGDVRRAHAVDEFVPIDELVTAARTLALTAVRFCGHAG